MTFGIVLVLVLVGLMFLVRVAPTDPTVWHPDPLTVPTRADGGCVVRPEGGDMPAPVFRATPEQVLQALHDIALRTPRTMRVAGALSDGRVTYVTRSALWGFPDYTTVAAVKVPGGAAPVIYARLRFGRKDFGVNRARVEGWLAALARDLPAA